MAAYDGVPVDDVWAWAGGLARWLSDEGFCHKTSDATVSQVGRAFVAVDHRRVELVPKAAAVRDALEWLRCYVIPAASQSTNPYASPPALGGGQEVLSPEHALANEARAVLGSIGALQKRVDEFATIRNERAQEYGVDPGMELQIAYDDAVDGFEAFVAAINPVWMQSGILGLPVPHSLKEWKERCTQLEMALKMAGFEDTEIDAIVPGAAGPKAIAQRRYRHRKSMAAKAAADRWKAARRELLLLKPKARARILSFLRPAERLASMDTSERAAQVNEFQRLGLLACAAMLREGGVGATDRAGAEDT